MIVLIFIGTVSLLRWPGWKITNIEVDGTEMVDPQEIKAKVEESITGNLLFFLPRNSILLVSPENLSSLLRKEFARIGSATIKKQYPDKLKISVSERVLWGIICSQNQEGNCMYIDTTGFGMESAPQSSGTLILKIKTDQGLLPENTQVLDPALVEQMKYIAENTQKIIASPVVEFALSTQTPDEFKVRVAEGFSLLFAREGGLENSFSVLKKVLESEVKDKRPRLDYIDLRFGNKVFFKFR